MKILTQDATLVCRHESGKVSLPITMQRYVTVQGVPVLVRGDLVPRPIGGCANMGPTIKPCALTVNVTRGYSDFVRIDGRPICLESLVGITDGTPPAGVEYHVRTPGQSLVESEG